MRTRLVLLLAILLSLMLAPAYAQEDTESVDFAYEGIRFSYDASLASGIEATDVEAVPLEDDMPVWAANPAYTLFTFTDYAGGLSFYQNAQISIYSTADFEAYTDPVSPEFGMTGQLDMLLSLLEEEADLSEYAGVTDNQDPKVLPYLPVANAAQVFRALPEYLEFEGGRGIRYLVYYSQSVNPITDQEIFYTFQGLTDDGAHYVAAVFPVKTGILPEEIDYQDFDYAAFEAEYLSYLDEIAFSLNDFPPDLFTPSLTTLDAVIASLSITPD